jgi:hypothetical protein
MCEQVTRSWQSPDHGIDVFQGGSARRKASCPPINSLSTLNPSHPRIRALGVL